MREFWIYDVMTQEHGEIPVAFKHHKNIKGAIHVIEKSAYDALAAKLAIAVEALETTEKILTTFGGDVDPVDVINKALAKIGAAE